MDPESIPERWSDRAVPLVMVPLTPDESSQLFGEGPIESDELGPDADLMRLVARGLSAEVIATRLGLAPRSVYRRLARLREVFGIASTAELATELALRGFGMGDPTADGTGDDPGVVEISAQNEEEPR
jgi:DNA-binding CsgD family transcriptional regulator